MRKLTISTQMTIDGVIHDGIDEWLTWNGQHEEVSFDLLYAADALLLGRKNYEGLAAVWPTLTDDSGFADRINSMPKHVASRTLEGPLTWNATLLNGDLVECVTRLKQQPGGNLLSFGCGELAHELVTHGLADEVLFWIHPVVWGDGARPFHGHVPVNLHLASTTMFDSGVALLTYRTQAPARRVHGTVTERS